MREAAERVLAPQFRECWRVAEQPFLQAIYDVQSPRLAFGRVTIMGDASYVARLTAAPVLPRRPTTQ